MTKRDTPPPNGADTGGSNADAPDGLEASTQEQLSPVRAAIAARKKQKEAAANEPPPAAGRKAQEVDAEPVGPKIRVKGTTTGGPHYPRSPSTRNRR